MWRRKNRPIWPGYATWRRSATVPETPNPAAPSAQRCPIMLGPSTVGPLNTRRYAGDRHSIKRAANAPDSSHDAALGTSVDYPGVPAGSAAVSHRDR